MAETDLNLVRTFLHLYETRSVTRTAERMSITQPSVSHALGRLRKQFNDNLFSRSAGGLKPTERAVAVYPMLRQAIEVIETTMSDVGGFDPTTSRRTFRMHATDLGEMSLVPAVLGRIAAAAPAVDLHITPFDFAVAETELRQGQADAVICTPGSRRPTSPAMRCSPTPTAGFAAPAIPASVATRRWRSSSPNATSPWRPRPGTPTSTARSNALATPATSHCGSPISQPCRT